MQPSLVTCDNDECGAEFVVHGNVRQQRICLCPTCRKKQAANESDDRDLHQERQDNCTEGLWR
jgi:hypothetical protein